MNRLEIKYFPNFLQRHAIFESAGREIKRVTVRLGNVVIARKQTGGDEGLCSLWTGCSEGRGRRELSLCSLFHLPQTFLLVSRCPPLNPKWCCCRDLQLCRMKKRSEESSLSFKDEEDRELTGLIYQLHADQM